MLGAADVGRRIRFVEWIFKRDCGAVQHSTGTQECHDVTKNGASFPTNVGRAEAGHDTAVHRHARPCRARRWRTRSCTRPAATWTGQGTITKAFFWQRCNTAGEGCATIPGATGATYRLTSADVGARIRVVETASNEGGTAQAVSTRRPSWTS